jgi:hypothetical protein
MVIMNNISSNIFPSIAYFLGKYVQMVSSAKVCRLLNLENIWRNIVQMVIMNNFSSIIFASIA